MQDLGNTQYFKVEKEPELQVKDVLEVVYRALNEKGYNPVNQIVGYIMSGDPTYITSHMNARSLIMRVERDELVEEVLKFYLEQKYFTIGKTNVIMVSGQLHGINYIKEKYLEILDFVSGNIMRMNSGQMIFIKWILRL